MGALEVVTAKSLVEDWNKMLEENKQIIQDSNQSLKQMYEKGTISAASLCEAWKPLPKPVSPPGYRWSRWFLKQYGWSLLSRQPDNQAWLPYEHSDMIAARAYVNGLVEQEKVHPATILNYDQLWRCCWSFSGKLMMKDRTKMQKRSRRGKIHKRVDKKLHAVKGNRRSVTVSRLHTAFCFNCFLPYD